jgi:ribosome-associated heat shock protein Hsp15
MRIDKYLWCVRLFKTRSLASEHVRKERILIDDAIVKASREINVGDEFVVKRHGYEQRFIVRGLPKSRVGAKLVADYLEEKTPQEELDKKEFLQIARNMGRKKGLGRPTKKDRRDLDKLL